MKITVFGGSAPKPGTPAYQQAYELGALIGKNGDTILTGGYIGTMEAASRGCAEAEGHVVGVTCDEIENWRAVKPNQWVQEEYRFPTIHERLLGLIQNCEAAFALPGGVGTLAEIVLMWNMMQIASIPTRPLIVIGSGWEKTIRNFNQLQESYVAVDDREMVSFAPDVPKAFALLGTLRSKS